MKYEDGFYWARPVIENEESPAQVVEIGSLNTVDVTYVYEAGNDHIYSLEDWVILEKVERK